MSLKSNLNQLIRDRKGGVVSISEIETFCKKYPAKMSNAERRLRPSESPNIERVMKNGAIVGYKYVESSSVKIPDWFFETRKPVIQQRLI